MPAPPARMRVPRRKSSRHAQEESRRYPRRQRSFRIICARPLRQNSHVTLLSWICSLSFIIKPSHSGLIPCSYSVLSLAILLSCALQWGSTVYISQSYFDISFLVSFRLFLCLLNYSIMSALPYSSCFATPCFQTYLITICSAYICHYALTDPCFLVDINSLFLC